MIDPVEVTGEFAQYIFNVHLDDTEIPLALGAPRWHSPVENAKWRSLLRGLNVIDWKGFFIAPTDAGYNEGAHFTGAFKEGFHASGTRVLEAALSLRSASRPAPWMARHRRSPESRNCVRPWPPL